MSFFSNDNLDLSNDEFNYYEVLGCNELSNVSFLNMIRILNV